MQQHIQRLSLQRITIRVHVSDEKQKRARAIPSQPVDEISNY